MLLQLVLFNVFFVSVVFASKIRTLTSNNFNNTINNDEKPWVVFFYDNSKQCKEVMTQYEEAADAFRGVVNFGIVDAQMERALSKLYEDFFPTLKFFIRSKEFATNFNSSLSLNSIVNFMQHEIERKVEGGRQFWLEQKWTDDSSGEALAAYFTPADVRCTNFPFEWSKLSRNLEGKVNINVVNCDEVRKPECGESKLPQVYYHRDGSGSRYQGKQSAVEMKKWYVTQTTLGVQPQGKVTEITDKASIVNSCTIGAFCVISFLPDLQVCPTECRKKLLRHLETLKAKYHLKNWGFLWAEGGAQVELEDIFKLGRHYPTTAIVDVNVMQLKYYKYNGDFLMETMESFFDDVDRGRARSFPLDLTNIPTIFKTRDGLKRLLSEEGGMKRTKTEL